MISKAKFNRLQSLQAAVGTSATNATLDFADQIRASAPDLADLVHDVLVYRWISAGFLNDRQVNELDRHDLFHMLGWYYVARWSENDQTTSSPEDEKNLQQLTALKIQPTSQVGLEYTGLMTAIYHYRRDVSSALSVNGSYLTNDLLYWFYIHGVQEYRLQRCVSPAEIEALNRPLAAYESGLISILDLWALSRGSSPENVDLASLPGQMAANQLAAEIRQSDPMFQLFERVSTPAVPSASNGLQQLTREFPWLARQIAKTERGQYHVVLGRAEYFGRGLQGSRLLIPGGWHDLDDYFVWSKHPASSLLFSPDLDPVRSTMREADGTGTTVITKIGLSVHPYPGASMLGQIVSVFLNGRFVADVPVSDMLSSDTVLVKHVAENVVNHATNLLQFITSRPLIPSEHLNSHDTRQLGVALRRVWFG